MKQYISLDTELNGIGTYKDTLDLSTGVVTRAIYCKILTGEENFSVRTGKEHTFGFAITASENVNCVCSHYTNISSSQFDVTNGIFAKNTSFAYISDLDYSNTTDLKAYLRTQYQNGTPVTVWYVLATATTETISLPVGLYGTVEGFTTQTGTPTSSSPIYPTVNHIDDFCNKHYLKYGTETDTITTFPKQIIGDGTTLSAWEIKGNLQQQGTPSSSSPIFPSECGERTENLFDDHNVISIRNLGDRYGVILPDGVYSIYNDTPNQVIVGINDFQSREVACDAHSTATVTLDNSFFSNDAGFYLPLNASSQGGCTIVAGSTPPDHYIPYGYKLPVVCGGSTTNIYLSEPIRKMGTYKDIVSSSGTASRKIKKLVLTGEEQWAESSRSGGYRFTVNLQSALQSDTTVGAKSYCSHLKLVGTGQTYSTNQAYTITGTSDLLMTLDANTRLADWKSFLAQEYSNGTPVCVWYVLSTPTTESFTAPTIPTTGTAEQFDVNTTLKPSEVSLTYHGWHEHEDTEFTT